MPRVLSRKIKLIYKYLNLRPNHQIQRHNEIQSPDVSLRTREWKVNIGENLVQASYYHATSSWDNIYIYRIPHCLREAAGDDKAYSPQIVSLGPYHHGQERLKDMEKHKWRALNQMVSRNKQRTEQDYFDAVKELEHKARDCYEGPICDCPAADKNNVHDDSCRKKFVQMMVLDSCFMLEIFWGAIKGFTELGYSKHDPIFAMRGNMHMIQRDMIKLENQIPLFVLNKLFSLQLDENSGDDQKGAVSRLAIRFFDPLTPTYDPSSLGDSDRIFFVDPPAGNGSSSETSEELHLLDVFRRNLLGSTFPSNEMHPVADKRRQHVIPCVTKLKEEGITFERRETDKFWDIKFKNGVLKIPRLLIHNGTKSLFLNLIAYEQCHLDCKNEITSYIIFMDNLIDNPEDVTYLYSCGIIEHWLGSDAEVAKLFNQMCQEVVFDRNGSYLSVVSGKVNRYHARKWNGWRASLKHKYFNNPWSIISFFAAVVLLMLTAAQSFYTLYAYHRPPR